MVKENTIKEKISDVFFSIFYFILFVVQMLPAAIAPIFGLLHPLSITIYALAIVSMVVHSIKFPCHMQMVFRSGVIASWIALIIYGIQIM